MRLLLDTWGWVSLSNRREPRHEAVKAFYHEFRQRRGIIHTTDYILDETYTLLFRRLPYPIAGDGCAGEIDDRTR